jgi:hypothetical protein
MNIKRLSLITALLAWPAAYAHAADITIVVPVSLSNVPAANRQVIVNCRVGVGVGPTTVPRAIWPGTSAVGAGIYRIDLPASDGGNRAPAVARATVQITSSAGRSLDEATHYKCWLSNAAGQPTLAGQNEVSGAIPR